jgi:hypothetical protein
MLGWNPETSRAVLIGNSNFPQPGSGLPDLPAVRRNLEDLAAILKRPTIAGLEQVDILADAWDPTDVAVGIAEAAGQAGSLLLVYYTGHGLLTERGRFHLAVGRSTQRWIAQTALPIEQVHQAMQDSAARFRVLLLDCCFSARGIEDLQSGEESAIRARLDKTGAYTMTSASATEPSKAPAGARNTEFTGALLDVLGKGVVEAGPELTLDDIFDTVRGRLPASKPQRANRQDGGDLRFVRNLAYVGLTGTWRGSEGGLYFLRQLDGLLWWAGVGGNFANVFCGQIEDGRVVGLWCDVPLGETDNSGSLQLVVTNDRELVRDDVTGDFTAALWFKAGRSVMPRPFPRRQAPTSQHDPRSLTGVWAATDDGQYYVRQNGKSVWWLGLSPDGGASYASVFSGSIRNDRVSGTWCDVPMGSSTGAGQLALRIQLDGGRPARMVNDLGRRGAFGRWQELRRLAPGEHATRPT